MNTRVSPLNMGMEPAEVVNKDGWQVALTYLGEKKHNPLFISDLSHVSKWILQAKDLGALREEGLNIPPGLGEATFENGILMTRLTPSECFLMVLGDSKPEFNNAHFSDMTEAWALFVLVGPQCLDVLSKLSPLDLDELNRTVPFAVQGPVNDLRCILIRLHGLDHIPGLLISTARGYGHYLLQAFLDAGKEYEVSIAGWQRFEGWLDVKAKRL